MTDRLRLTRGLIRQAAGLVLAVRWLQGLVVLLLVLLFAPSYDALAVPALGTALYFALTGAAFIRYHRGRAGAAAVALDLLGNVGALLLLAHHAGGTAGPVLYLLPMTVGLFIVVFGPRAGALAVGLATASGLACAWAEQTGVWPLPAVSPLVVMLRPTIDMAVALTAAVLLLFGTARTIAWVRVRERQLERETARARAAAEFQAGLAELSATGGVGSTVENTCERARRLLGCPAAMICLSEEGRLAVRAFAPPEAAPAFAPLALDDDSAPARAVREGRAIVLPIDLGDGRAKTVPDVRRILAVPLVAGPGDVVGALVFFDDRTLHDGEELRVRAEILAHTATALLEHARLVDELQEETHRVRALLRLSEEIGQGASYDETLLAVCRSTRDLLEADRATVFRWQADAGRYVAAAQDGMLQAEAAEWRRVSFVVDAGPEPLPEPYRAPLREGRLIAVPLEHGGHRYGLLLASRTATPGRFGARELAVLQAIARQAAMALANLRLHEEERDAAAQAAALLEVASELNMELEPPALVARVATRAVELARADVALVAVRDTRSGQYRVEGMHGVAAERAEELRHANLGSELYGGEDGTPVLAPEWRRRLGGEAELSVPMIWGGRVVGVLTLLWTAEVRPLPRHEALARGLSHQAAVALQNVHLVEDLREASRLKSEFVATMSHELRTPLNVIMGYTDLLVEDAFGVLGDEARNVLGRIQRSSRELFDLITATLDLNRLESGKSRVTLEEVAVPELFAQLEAETAERLDTRGLELRWQVTADLPALETDRGKLRIVLKNLVGNAIKFTERGQVTIAAAPADGSVVFTVADTGIGIRSEDLPVIFEMFRQVESANTRRHGGVGLGLYIVKRLLDELHADIDVQSEYGMGTTFQVRVPFRAAASAAPL